MNILQLTSYPTKNPMHGGQIRATQIASELRRAGHSVKSVAIYSEHDYADSDSDDIPFRKSSKFWNNEPIWLSDYYGGLFASADRGAVKALSAIAKRFAPHVIIFEQPWLFMAAKCIAENNVKLVHSSQNIEWRLKDRLFVRDCRPDREEIITAIRDMELAAVKEAHLTVACTTDDAEYFKKSAEDSRAVNIAVAGNGVEPFSCTEDQVNGWRNFFKRPIPVFVSSAHLPNAQSFWDMMSPGLTFLKPSEEILIIGGVSSVLMQAKGFEAFSDVNLSRLNLAGTREKKELQALVRASHAVLLPITDGEGSNLKTAEALESGCSIIGTRKAFRGFEAALSLPHVHIADESGEFRLAIRRVLDAPRYTGGTPFEIRSRFYWEQQLRPLVDAIGALKE